MLAVMPRDVRHVDMTLEELGARIDAAAVRESHDEPYLDENFNPITPEQLSGRYPQA
jgi:hypothetical protein